MAYGMARRHHLISANGIIAWRKRGVIAIALAWQRKSKQRRSVASWRRGI